MKKTGGNPYMSNFSYRIFHRAFFSALLFLTSFSAFSEELIIKFSSSIAHDQSIALLTDYGLEIIEKIDSLNICTVAVPDDTNTEQLINALKSDSRIKYVEKNMDSGQGAFLPNDAAFEDQWHHVTINSERAWDITKGSNDVIIAVLDSGIEIDNPDFSSERFLSGFDFVNNDNTPDDDLNHGTYVIGVIAANTDNGIGGAGVDHNTRILPVKVINENNSGTTFDLVQGIEYAVSQGANIINMSLGNYPHANSLTDVFLMAQDNGTILISSAGNNGIDSANVGFPGASPLTISVGATDINNNRAFFSATGSALDVVAPGSAVRTTSYRNNSNLLDFFSGTSASAPIVSGIAGLAKALDPDLTQDEFLNIITVTSEDQIDSSGLDTPGRDDFFGWGLINALAVLEKVNPGSPIVPARIEAQNFTANFDSTPENRGDDTCNTGDVDTQATNDLGGICTIGWTTAGEWLEYEIFVEQPGQYDINLLLSSQNGGNVSMEVDGIEIDQVSANTGHWNNYVNHVISTQLSDGAHTVRVNFVDGNVNFNFLDFQLIGVAVPTRIEAETFL